MKSLVQVFMLVVASNGFAVTGKGSGDLTRFCKEEKDQVKAAQGEADQDARNQCRSSVERKSNFYSTHDCDMNYGGRFELSAIYECVVKGPHFFLSASFDTEDELRDPYRYYATLAVKSKLSEKAKRTHICRYQGYNDSVRVSDFTINYIDRAKGFTVTAEAEFECIE